MTKPKPTPVPKPVATRDEIQARVDIARDVLHSILEELNNHQKITCNVMVVVPKSAYNSTGWAQCCEPTTKTYPEAQAIKLADGTTQRITRLCADHEATGVIIADRRKAKSLKKAVASALVPEDFAAVRSELGEAMVTKTGKVLTDADVEALAVEAETTDVPKAVAALARSMARHPANPERDHDELGEILHALKEELLECAAEINNVVDIGIKARKTKIQ